MGKLNLVLSTEQSRKYDEYHDLTDFWDNLHHAVGYADLRMDLDDLHWKFVEAELAMLRAEPDDAWIATQNPAVMDRLTFESAADFSDRVRQWRDGELKSVSTEEAEDFYADYKIGFQHVSELLRVKGLW